MNGPDYYRILQIQPDAPAPLIHSSYRTLVRRALSDSPGGDEIARLDAAYAVLSDPQRRAAYDVQRAGQSRAATGPSATCLFCGAPHGIVRVFARDDECPRCASPLYPAERHRLGLARPHEDALPALVEPSQEERTDERLALTDALAHLSERDRELLALRYGADLKAKQIAALADMDTHAVEVALSRALARLREIVGDDL